ncbi:hypothetical protein [Pseudomonas sp. PDM22]|uniref:hypothetical protein n=1 Tax=Pseudomonas sp. PDM22 TaxID=2769287 RepID=UPI00111C3754|nr:hypothetical protein [Pseudomonas sp. PDM22]MBD9516235.1 hypothetical protein [Pseudomonas sp. PDM22]
MAIIEIESSEMSKVVDGLAKVVFFERDLPLNVFIKEGLSFWFFERPIVDYLFLFSGLISISLSAFGSSPYVKFSGRENIAGSCVRFDGGNIEEDTDLVSRKFSNFFGGKVGYPIFLFNDMYDWVAIESAHDEFGVIAVDSGRVPREFIDFLEFNFIPKAEMIKLASGTGAQSIDAKIILKYYL